MRKFTKEITSLIASVAVGTAAGVGAISASSEEIVQTAGVPMVSDEIIEPTTVEEIPPLAGDPLPPDEWIEIPTEEIPPLAGEPLLPDEWIEIPTEEFPPLAGEPLPPDEWIETIPTEELPPLAGDVAPPDGDVNGDGSFNIADVVTFQKWLQNSPDAKLYNWTAADLCADGELDVFDLTLMKKSLIDKEQ